MNIPFYSSVLLHKEVKEEFMLKFEKVLSEDKFFLGTNVDGFEKEFSEYCDSKYCISCASGLDALYLILRGYEIGTGDEVIVPSNTFIATALAVSATGAKPVFVEPQVETYNIDAFLIEKAISSKTKAIIVVHLYGRPSNMEQISKVASKYGLKIIEDAAQAHGALYNGSKVGTLGDAGAFSFFPRKNLGALGDGGAVITNDKLLEEKVRTIARYGSKIRYVHTHLGINSRLDELQAAFLRIKLKRLDKWNLQRSRIAERYSNEINNELIIKPMKDDSVIKHSWYLYVIRTKHRDLLKGYLSSYGIESQVHYPIPLYRQECYRDNNASTELFPVTEMLSNEILSIPIWPGMTEMEVNYVIKVINNWNI
jgi:dTDP-4-amino-4,6-dideoxygalactose transaminase